jgi:hypothetical protein
LAIFLISTSLVSGITGMSYCTWLGLLNVLTKTKQNKNNQQNKQNPSDMQVYRIHINMHTWFESLKDKFTVVICVDDLSHTMLLNCFINVNSLWEFSYTQINLFSISITMAIASLIPVKCNVLSCPRLILLNLKSKTLW